MIRHLTIASAAILALSASSAQATQATLARAWVSGHGTDAPGCGYLTTPCRQIAYVLNYGIVAPGGEIDILDPSGFVPFTIAQAVSIINNGVGTVSIQQTTAGQDAITIATTTSENITLRGLTLNGLGVARNGIAVTSQLPPVFGARTINIIDCLVENFSDSGISVKPALAGGGSVPYISVNISNTFIVNNTINGAIFDPTAINTSTTIYNSTISGNSNGLNINGTHGSMSAYVIKSNIDHNGIGGGSGIAISGSYIILKNSSVLSNNQFNGNDILNTSSTMMLVNNNLIGGVSNNGNGYTDNSNYISHIIGSALTFSPLQ